MARAEGRSGMGRGVPSLADYGIWGSVPTGSGAEPRPKTDFGVFEGHGTLLFVPI